MGAVDKTIKCFSILERKPNVHKLYIQCSLIKISNLLLYLGMSINLEKKCGISIKKEEKIHFIINFKHCFTLLEVLIHI